MEPAEDWPEEWDGGPTMPLDDRESALIRHDLVDLGDFEETFTSEGYKGVSVWCTDCSEDHFYPWEMLRQNLEALLETGETPVHEPAFQPNPEHYIPWEYARGYVDALRDNPTGGRRDVGACRRCDLDLDALGDANFCPRCGTPLLASRLADALDERGMSASDIAAVLGEVGL